MDINIQPIRRLSGERSIPGDKSISHRALMIASLAEGDSTIRGLSTAADVKSTARCLRTLGVDIEEKDGVTVVHGKGPHGFRKPAIALNAGNSGTTMRLLAGILSGQRFDSTLVGDESLSKRPMKRIIDPLRLMGANISGTPAFTAPLVIASTYDLQPIEYRLPVPSAQVKSAVLFAGLFAKGTTHVVEDTPTRDHTERMLGLKVANHGGERVVEVRGGHRIAPRDMMVPGDISAAMFLMAAAFIVPDSELTIRNVGLNGSRTEVLNVLRQMHASFSVEHVRSEGGEEVGDIVARASELRTDFVLEGKRVAEVIDEIPILAVLAAFADGTFALRDAAELRQKESDRISTLVGNLRMLGVDAEEYPDGFAFQSKKDLIGRGLESSGDHRIAMAFGVAGLRIPGIIVHGAECVDISFPGFWRELSDLEMKITAPHS